MILPVAPQIRKRIWNDCNFHDLGHTSLTAIISIEIRPCQRSLDVAVHSLCATYRATYSQQQQTSTLSLPHIGYREQQLFDTFFRKAKAAMSGAGGDGTALVPHPGRRVRRTASYGAALVLSKTASFRAAAVIVGKQVATIQRAVERFRNTGSYQRVVGKPQLLNDIEMMPLKDNIFQRGIVGNHMVAAEVRKEMIAIVKKRVEAEGGNGDGVVISSRAAGAFIKKIFQEVPASKSSTQTQRRAEAGSDIRNYASLAAALRAILFGNPLADDASLRYRIPSTNVFNLDAIGLKLASDGAQVVMLVSTQEVLEELDRRHADAARIGTGKHTLFTPHLYILTNAAGAAATVVFLLKDQNKCFDLIP